jgi:uncharacterized membrane protein
VNEPAPTAPTMEERVTRLERDVSRLKGRVEAFFPPPPPDPALVDRPSPDPAPPPRRRRRPARQVSAPRTFERRVLRRVELEDSLLGTWLARVGAIALLIGAAFGFKYAVDKGLIGPAARVGLGIVGAIVALLWSERARGRSYHGLAQAVGAAGVALLYLSMLSAFLLYGLIPASLGLGVLTLLAVGSGLLARRHDSLALGVLTTVLAFGNAVLVGLDEGTPAQRAARGCYTPRG